MTFGRIEVRFWTIGFLGAVELKEKLRRVGWTGRCGVVTAKDSFRVGLGTTVLGRQALLKD